MAGSPRQLHTQQIHFLRKGITFADKLTTVTLGYIPAGSVVIKPMSGVHVSTVFNGTAPQTLDIGTSVTTAIWATALALSVTTFVACDETTTSFYVSSDTTVQAVIGGSGATAGEAQLIIAYVPNTDG
jgi:hypothetical protein